MDPTYYIVAATTKQNDIQHSKQPVRDSLLSIISSSILSPRTLIDRPAQMDIGSTKVQLAAYPCIRTSLRKVQGAAFLHGIIAAPIEVLA